MTAKTLPPLILASKSRARRETLARAGLEFESCPADIDEDKILKTARGDGRSPEQIAQALADKKALRVSKQQRDALVIGADQVLECAGALFSKAKTEEEAREKLKALRGRAHILISAVSAARGGKILWQHSDQARLFMHDFDDNFLERYVTRAGAALMDSVGAYEIEGAGPWLFEKIEGDFFTILGLPLLPLLTYLQQYYGGMP